MIKVYENDYNFYISALTLLDEARKCAKNVLQ